MNVMLSVSHRPLLAFAASRFEEMQNKQVAQPDSEEGRLILAGHELEGISIAGQVTSCNGYSALYLSPSHSNSLLSQVLSACVLWQIQHLLLLRSCSLLACSLSLQFVTFTCFCTAAIQTCTQSATP